MRISSAILIILFIVSAILGADKATIAVLDLETSGVSTLEADYLTRRIRHELFQTDKYKVLERAAMEEILTEQGFQLTGCTSSECAVQAGQLLGVQYMVAGSVGKIGSLYTIFLRLIDVESGEITASATADCRGSIEEVATNTTTEAVAKLLGGSGSKSAKIPKTETLTTSGYLSGMTFVTIPSGSFMMGSNDGRGDEKPMHNVYIKSFRMMTTEVTQAQWTAVMGNNPSNWKGDDLPVEQVSWNDCQEFIRKLNQLDPGKGYRLSTEAEWEYACRAGTTTKYYTGNSDSDLGRAGWYSSNSGSKTHPVGQKEPNAWGLYDMHGNVWEWCADWYHGNYNGAPQDGSARLSPSGNSRVLRGGSWRSGPSFCRSASRNWFDPDIRDYYLGFRLARSL